MAKMVTLVVTETLTPYRKGEIFTVTEEQATMLLTRNMSTNDFGPIYPKVKVRLFDPEKDKALLLENGTLNQKEAAALRKELYGKEED